MVSTAEDFLRHLADAKKSSANMVCCCPAHNDILLYLLPDS